ncbi:MAG: nicotinate-nucleotide--dimethylbenzimidazole phosphoribosyltransferase [Aestuariivita sp.]|nr:nicotinate-nucleotide--dimethylbenzimidazole phosphoribosyltransferase [Aestuariivita sp.]
MDFHNFNEFRSLLAKAPAPSSAAMSAAAHRNEQLTKPPGSLGRLEELAIWYVGWRGDAQVRMNSPQIIVFAGNHGVAARGVSAFPTEVTAQMVENFKVGGAAINQLADVAEARLDVYDLHLDSPTEDFTKRPAMSEDECVQALRAGWQAVSTETDLLVVGEMGIGNTTAAAAVAYALFGGQATDWVGRGTGVSDQVLAKKTDVVERAVALHRGGDGLQILERLGGRELAAMAGAIARARMERIPVLLDGFICCASAACLHQLRDDALDHAVAAHLSAEGAHAELLAALGKEALVSLGLRLGEGSGAALAIHIMKCALACHFGMATFAEAGVSNT